MNMDTLDSHSFSSNEINGNVFLTDSVISTPQTPHGLRDFNNSQSEEQILLEAGDLRRKLTRKRKLEDDDERKEVNLGKILCPGVDMSIMENYRWSGYKCNLCLKFTNMGPKYGVFDIDPLSLEFTTEKSRVCLRKLKVIRIL